MTSQSVKKNILAFSGRSHSEVRNNQAFAALKNDGSVVTWGSSADGGDSSSVSDQINSGVVQLFSSNTAFAALKNDGSVVTWGKSEYGGDSSGNDLTNSMILKKPNVLLSIYDLGFTNEYLTPACAAK